MLKNIVLHGVGEAVIYDFLTGREILRLKKMESTSWTTSVDETDVSGGDGLDIFENFETGRSQMMAFQNNEFDMRMLEAAIGKRPVKTLSAPIFKPSEGYVIPQLAPFTADLKKQTAQSASVRILYSETREDLSPKPPAASAALNAGASTFPASTTLNIRITSLVNGIESIASDAVVISTGGSARGIDVTMPQAILSVDPNLIAYDVECDGFNVYVSIGSGPWMKNNAALLSKGDVYPLINNYPVPVTASVSAGLTNPPAISYITGLSVTPFAMGTPAMDYNVGLAQYEANGQGALGKGIFIYYQDVISDTADQCYFIYDDGALAATKVLTGPSGAGTVITPDDTDDYDAVLVYKPTTGMRGTVYVGSADYATWVAAHPELTVIRQLTAVFSAPALAPDDFTFNAGAITSALENGYAMNPLYFTSGANDYSDMLGVSPGPLGSNLFIGNDIPGYSHTMGGALTQLMVEGIDVAENIYVTLVQNTVGNYRKSLIHSANIDPATLLGANETIVVTFEDVFTAPVAPNGPFVFNAAALVEWPAGDALYLVPTLAGQFDVSGATITFADADAGKGVLVDYVWTTSSTEYQAEVVDMLNTCLRKYVKISLSQTFNSKDGSAAGYQSIIFKAKYSGDFNIETTRTDAATHSMEFKIFDAERADGKIAAFTKYDSGLAENC